MSSEGKKPLDIFLGKVWGREGRRRSVGLVRFLRIGVYPFLFYFSMPYDKGKVMVPLLMGENSKFILKIINSNLEVLISDMPVAFSQPQLTFWLFLSEDTAIS